MMLAASADGTAGAVAVVLALLLVQLFRQR